MKTSTIKLTILLIGSVVFSTRLLAQDKNANTITLTTEKNGKEETVTKTLADCKTPTREEVEQLFGVKKSNYDKFIVKVECSKTVTTEGNDTEVLKDLDLKIDDIDMKVDAKVVIITNKDGKVEKKVIHKKGKLNDEEIEKLLKENGVDTKVHVETIDHDGKQIKMSVVGVTNEKDGEGKETVKKVVIKTGKDGKISDEDMKMLKEQGIDVNIDEKAKGKVIRKMIVVRMDLQEITKSDIEEANKKGARLSVDAPQLHVDQLSFFPNPNNGKFNLSFTLPGKGNTLVSVFDITGREVYREELPDFTGSYSKEIDLTKENKGTYIIQVQQNGQASTKKLLVE